MFKKAAGQPRPPRGWVRAVRDALGITSRQLAARMGLAQSTIIALEKGEAAGTVTLNTMREAAEALNCQLVYALAPRTSLTDMVQQRARALAKKKLARVRHTMRLEGQATLNTGAITWSLALGGAPQADFRPRTAVRIGAEAGEGPWRVSAALTHSDYAVGPVLRFDLRLAREIDDGVQLFFQAGLVNDENGENRQGYGIGASWRLPAGPVLDGSWSDGAESADGFTVEVQAATVGLTFEMTDDLHIRAGLISRNGAQTRPHA